MPLSTEVLLDHIANYLLFLSDAPSFWFTLNTSYNHPCPLVLPLPSHCTALLLSHLTIWLLRCLSLHHPLVVLSLCRSLVILHRLFVASPLVTPPSRPLVVPPSHPLIVLCCPLAILLRWLVVALPLVAPPSCCPLTAPPCHCIALAGFCVASHRAALSSSCHAVLLSSSHCAALLLSHLTSWLLHCLSSYCPLVARQIRTT
jgi:hypothetical protein